MADGHRLGSILILELRGKSLLPLLVGVFDKMTDKWGNNVGWNDLLAGRNPVAQAIYELSQEQEDENE